MTSEREVVAKILRDTSHLPFPEKANRILQALEGCGWINSTKLTSDAAVEAAAECNWETSRGLDYRGHWKLDIGEEKRKTAKIAMKAAITAAIEAAQGPSVDEAIGAVL